LVVGLGLDLVELGRVARMLDRWGPRLLDKLMGLEEAEALPSGGEERTLALARAIAAKEAGSKAIGTGWSRGVRWRDVVLAAGPPPAVHLVERAAAEARRLGSAGACRVRFERRGDLVLCEVRLLGA
jgi:holo-[acyl-carrier protein] synthase